MHGIDLGEAVPSPELLQQLQSSTGAAWDYFYSTGRRGRRPYIVELLSFLQRAMSDFLEGVVTLFPSDAGGRSSAISPRDGSYRPFASTDGGARLRIRIIEGPPSIAPGHSGRVVVEIESDLHELILGAGTEFELIEHDRRVGILTVARLWRSVVPV